MALSEGAQRTQKREMLVAMGLDVDTLEPAPASLGYRMSSKRVAFGGPGRLRLGSWVRGTHRPADMEGCLVDHPRLVAAAAELVRVAQRLEVPAFDERTGGGDLRFVWLKTNGQEVLLTLVTASKVSAAPTLAEALTLPAGIAWSVAAEGDGMRGTDPVLLRGAHTLQVETSAGWVPVGPLGFLQPNPAAIDAAWDALTEAPDVPADATVIDLYAGTGATTARLRARYRHVVPVESLADNAKRLGVVPETVETFLARHPGPAPGWVVANPPRKGLGPTVVRALRRIGAPRVHIMSCGPGGLARDLEVLTAPGPGQYRLEALRGWDTLPQTPHVELVAQLTRV